MTSETDPFRHILVATDFSDASQAAMHWAMLLARGDSGHIRLAHAVFGPTDLDIPAPIADEVARRLKEQERAIERERIRVDSWYRPGKPWDVIVELVEELAPNLVVLGSRGRSTYTRVRLGSTADRVIRAANAPVLVVRKVDETLTCPRGPVLVAMDFSEEAGQALREAVRLVRSLPEPSPFLLLHACDFPVEYGITSGAEVIASSRAEEAAEASASLERMAAELRHDGLEVDVSVREGYAATIVEETAERIGAGLIVLGTQGRSGLSHLMMGSVAERVLRHAECPVLTVNRSVVASTAGKVPIEAAR